MTALVIDHPRKEFLTDSQKFELADGTVVITATEGQPLALSTALFLLEMVKDHIIRLAHDD